MNKKFEKNILERIRIEKDIKFNRKKFFKTVAQMEQRINNLDQEDKNRSIRYLIRKVKFLGKENLFLTDEYDKLEAKLEDALSAMWSLKGLVAKLTEDNDKLRFKYESEPKKAN